MVPDACSPFPTLVISLGAFVCVTYEYITNAYSCNGGIVLILPTRESCLTWSKILPTVWFGESCLPTVWFSAQVCSSSLGLLWKWKSFLTSRLLSLIWFWHVLYTVLINAIIRPIDFLKSFCWRLRRTFQLNNKSFVVVNYVRLLYTVIVYDTIGSCIGHFSIIRHYSMSKSSVQYFSLSFPEPPLEVPPWPQHHSTCLDSVPLTPLRLSHLSVEQAVHSVLK